jgi:hypothetical protein
VEENIPQALKRKKRASGIGRVGVGMWTYHPSAPKNPKELKKGRHADGLLIEQIYA